MQRHSLKILVLTAKTIHTVYLIIDNDQTKSHNYFKKLTTSLELKHDLCLNYKI